MSTPKIFQMRDTLLYENVGGEVVALDMQSGSYFSLQSSAALIWSLIEKAASTEQIIGQIAHTYSVDREKAESDVVSFLGQLQTVGLITSSDQSLQVSLPLVADVESSQTYVPPALEIFNDVQDLLTIDPIHDVDEMGWPRTRQKTQPATMRQP